MPAQGYTSISFPTGLKKEIEKLFTDLEKQGVGLGYSSVTEFIKEASRLLLYQTREQYLSKHKK